MCIRSWEPWPYCEIQGLTHVKSLLISWLWTFTFAVLCLDHYSPDFWKFCSITSLQFKIGPFHITLLCLLCTHPLSEILFICLLVPLPLQYRFHDDSDFVLFSALYPLFRIKTGKSEMLNTYLWNQCADKYMNECLLIYGWFNWQIECPPPLKGKMFKQRLADHIIWGCFRGNHASYGGLISKVSSQPQRIDREWWRRWGESWH